MSRTELTVNEAKGKRKVPRASVGRWKSPGAPYGARRRIDRENGDMPGKIAAALEFAALTPVLKTLMKGQHENA